MYTLMLCAALFIAYSTLLYNRHKKLAAANKQAKSFSEIYGVHLYKAMAIAMFGAVCIAKLAEMSIPIIVSTSKSAILIPHYTDDRGNRIFVESVWAGSLGLVYGVRVLNADGSNSLYDIKVDEHVHVDFDGMLKDTGTWRVTTRSHDTTSPLLGWTFTGAQVTVVKVVVRLPIGAVTLLPR